MSVPEGETILVVDASRMSRIMIRTILKSLRPDGLVFEAGNGDAALKLASETSGGRRNQLGDLARAGMAVGIAGLFVEAHPNPDEALCDGPSALPLHQLLPFLKQMKSIDELVKGFEPLQI